MNMSRSGGKRRYYAQSLVTPLLHFHFCVFEFFSFSVLGHATVTNLKNVKNKKVETEQKHKFEQTSFLAQ